MTSIEEVNAEWYRGELTRGDLCDKLLALVPPRRVEDIVASVGDTDARIFLVEEIHRRLDYADNPGCGWIRIGRGKERPQPEGHIDALRAWRRRVEASP